MSEIKNYMRISDLARLSGIPRSTIHFYLRKGVLHSPMKTGQTMAYYDESHLSRLRLIQKMKMDLRMPIKFIKKKISELEKSDPKAHAVDTPIDGKGSAPYKPKEKRRQEIINAGIKIFSAKGYYHTKVQDITQDLGISTGTFYIYFPNKRELFIQVVDDIIRTILGDAAKAIKQEKDFVKRAQLRGRVFFEHYSKYSEILHQLRAEMASEDLWPQETVKKIYHDLTRPLIREARQAVEKGIIMDIDPDLLAYAMTGLIEIMSLRTTLDQKYSFEQIMAFITNLIVNGIGIDSDPGTSSE